MVQRRAPSCEVDDINKGSWTSVEDTKLVAFVQKHGHDNWRALPKLAGLKRCGKSCRLRLINYLRRDVKRRNFTEEEEMTIIRLHESLGNKWSKIAAHLHGRTDNEIKNVWHTHLKKRVEGIKPKNSPRRKAKCTATSSSDSCGTIDDIAGSSNTSGIPTELSDQQLMLPNCLSSIQCSDGNTNPGSNRENANLSKDHVADRCTEEERSSVTESWSNSSSSQTSAMLHELHDASWSTPQCAGDAYVNARLQDLLEIPCDSMDLYEIWRLMDDDCYVLAPDQFSTPMAEDGVPCFDDISAEPCNQETTWDAEKSIWLAYLENELDL